MGVNDEDQPENVIPRDPAFNAAEGHRSRIASIGYLRLPINHLPISNSFRDKRRFRSNIANFSHPRADGVPLGIW